MVEIIKKLAELNTYHQYKYIQLRVNHNCRTEICLVENHSDIEDALWSFLSYNESEIIKALDKLISEAEALEKKED